MRDTDCQNNIESNLLIQPLQTAIIPACPHNQSTVKNPAEQTLIPNLESADIMPKLQPELRQSFRQRRQAIRSDKQV